MKLILSGRTSVLLSCAVGAVLAAPTRGDDPPFFAGRKLAEHSRFVVDDWDFVEQENAPDSVHMTDDGLCVQAPPPQGEEQTPAATVTQHVSVLQPKAGRTITARFRFYIDHAADNQTKIGFYNISENPFSVGVSSDPPVNAAYLHVLKGVACSEQDCAGICTPEACGFGIPASQVKWVMRNPESENPEEQTENLTVITEYHVIDFKIVIHGVSSVDFCWKEPCWENWQCTTRDDSDYVPQPSSSEPLRFSAAILQQGGNLGHLAMELFSLVVEEE
jgi:hypothetical protein